MLIHSGSIQVRGNDNIKHILVDSEKTSDVTYYVSVDRNTGEVLGCNCPSGALNPGRLCKHAKAVIQQRFLQESAVDQKTVYDTPEKRDHLYHSIVDSPIKIKDLKEK